MLAIDRNKDDSSIIITVLRIYDDRDNIIARIDENGFWVAATVRKKRPDQSTLIVFDHSDIQILRIQFLNPQAILVEGLFRHPALRPKTMSVTKNAAILLPNHISFSELVHN